MVIEQISLKIDSFRQRAEAFLGANGLKLEPLDFFVAATEDEKIVACGGFSKNVIKCLATDENARDGGLINSVVSVLRSELRHRGVNNIFVFTKRVNKAIFGSLAFYTIAESDDAVLLESSARGVENFCAELKKNAPGGTKNGCIVMNANPFTKGHAFLAQKAAGLCDTLHIIAVKEDASEFSFELRLKMIKAGVASLKNAVVHEGGDYVVSKATFPAYFLKDSGVVNKNQAQLDADLFSRHIAPALNVKTRFVGSEPFDAVTSVYNDELKRILPERGVEVVVFERLSLDGGAVSAKRVRELLKTGNFADAARLLPETSVSILTQAEFFQ